jgi:hypothetical protein
MKIQNISLTYSHDIKVMCDVKKNEKEERKSKKSLSPLLGM